VHGAGGPPARARCLDSRTVHDAAASDHPPASPGFHDDTEAFRRHGHELVDWVADYLSRVGELPIQPSVEPGEIRARLPATAPEDPEQFEAIVRDLDDVVLPGITHWQSPGWFAYFPCNNSGPSILAELVSAGLGAQGMLWATSPACTEIEEQVVDWLAGLLGLPEQWKMAVGPGGGVIQSSASDSTHLAHVVARHRALGRAGAATDALVAYGSAQAHSSIEKGARVAGFRHIRLLDVDARLALRPDRLDAAIAEDSARGLVPAIVTSSIGTTATAAVDPVGAVAAIARRHDLWHHVDAAYAGSALICPELRVEQEGIARADSFTVNPHKWMFTNFDCNVLWVADRAPLLETLSIEPPYLQNVASRSGAVVDYRDWQVPLGRRFRSLKLWWVLRSYGARAIRERIREHVRLARELGDRVDAHPRLERVAPTSFGLVCFRHVDGNGPTDALAAAINAVATLHVTPSTIGDQRFIRVSVGQSSTGERDVERLWEAIAGAS
jgi:aromatic-L-amino-acid decarboxylase